MSALLAAATRATLEGPAGSRGLHAGGGGALARALEAEGAGALVALLDTDAQHGARLVLADDTVEVTAWREAGSLRTRTVWADGTRLEPPQPHMHVDAAAGPALRDTALVDALHDRARPLTRARGGWHAGGDTPHVPALDDASLGHADFRARWGVRASWMAGAMAGGIASVELVRAMRDAGFLASFGAGGLPLPAIEAALAALRPGDGPTAVAFNLLHSPAEPGLEEATIARYRAAGVRVVEASAFMGISPALAAWRVSGLIEDGGRIVARHGVIAKISRPEVAEPFLRPAPPKLVEELLAAGKISARQAELARRVPMADDLTVEADSGGHTDRRPLVVMLPVILRLRARIEAELNLGRRVGVGAAGGIGDPWSAAAAFAMGADHVVTGSVNQACVEAGTSTGVKTMLAEIGPADVTTCPAPDMFELGAEVQVLARGSLYPQRARQLRELYRSHGALEEIPLAERERLEKQVFQQPLGEVWASTRRFWEERDPREVERAERDPRHRMALVFRSYLGLSSRWARAGDASRKRDYQVWCGPAMGLFNDWTRGSALAGADARGVVRVNEALLRAAGAATRVRMAAALDPAMPAGAWNVRAPE